MQSKSLRNLVVVTIAAAVVGVVLVIVGVISLAADQFSGGETMFFGVTALVLALLAYIAFLATSAIIESGAAISGRNADSTSA